MQEEKQGHPAFYDQDYYAALGVEPEAKVEDIKKAYRKRALAHHPDKGGRTDVFQYLQKAYDVLSDAASREAYDAARATGMWESMEEEKAAQDAIPLPSDGISFGDMFQARHTEWVAQYKVAPLTPHTPSPTRCVPDFLQKNGGATARQYPDCEPAICDPFTYIAHQEKRPIPPKALDEKQIEGPITVRGLVGMLQGFVQGRYWGRSLDQLLAYLSNPVYQTSLSAADKQLANAVYHVLQGTRKPEVRRRLYCSICRKFPVISRPMQRSAWGIFCHY